MGITFTTTLPTRAFQGIPAVEASSAGILFVAWYAGPNAGEDQQNYVILTSSSDGGITWSGYWIIDPDNALTRAFDPCLWIDGNGRLHVFWNQSENIVYDGIAGTYEIHIDSPTVFNGSESWSTPLRITDGVMLNKPIYKNSEILLPSTLWYSVSSIQRNLPQDINVLAWDGLDEASLVGHFTPPSRSVPDEPMLFYRPGDAKLVCFVRATTGITRAISTDGGVSWWQDGVQPYFAGPETRFYVARLQSGKLMLIYHNDPSTRTKLTAYLSDNDGQSWPCSLLLDGNTGVSYPDAKEDANGNIYIVYDYNRTTTKKIMMARITQADIMAGSLVSGGFLARTVNQA